MANTYSAGVVTAYGAAVQGGYTGTYAEFCAQQAEYAENAQAVETAKDTASAAASYAGQASASASTSAQNALESAQTAAMNATRAETKATEASNSATAAQTAQTAAETARTGAETAQAAAEAAQAAAEAVAASIPSDYSELSGDVTDLESAIDNLFYEDATLSTTWSIGFINTSTGVNQTKTTSIRSGVVQVADETTSLIITLSDTTNYKFQVYQWTSSGSFVGMVSRYADGTNPVKTSDVGKYRICVAKIDGAEITDDEVDTISALITIQQHYFAFVDATSSESGKAADAAVVGEVIENVDSNMERIGFFQTSFSVESGTAHSSTSDQLPVVISQGKNFLIIVSGVITSAQIYAYYSDGTSEKLATSTRYEGVAEADIVYIGVYISTAYISESGTVTVSAYITDGLYYKTINIVDKDVTTTVLGAEIPADLTLYRGVSSSYATALRSAITSWMSEYAGDQQKVPFILHTDQHGRLTAGRKGIFDLINYLVNWDEVSAVFNLGDTVVDHWEDDTTNTDTLLRNSTLETAIYCVSSIPTSKQINVFGNHDTWYSGDVETSVASVLPSLQYLNPYFKANGLRTITCADNSGLMVVYDDKVRVKYLVIAGWDYADRSTTNYQYFWINQSHLDWIITEMSKNEGYDLILVSHVPLCLRNGEAVDPISGDTITLSNTISVIYRSTALNDLWNARKNKTSGTVTVGEVSTSFDFTGCTDDCLCAISGHTHYDAVQYVGNSDTGLLEVAFDWFDSNTIHFGLFDRRNRQLNVWKLSYDDDTALVENWQEPFDKA